MKLLICGGVMLLGFVFGVTYDQGLLDRTLRRDLKECQSRNAVLDDALNAAVTNKFKKRDYIYDAVQKQIALQSDLSRRNAR